MSHNDSSKPSQKLGTLSLTLISISAIIGLRNLPTFAVNGLASTFFLLVAAFLFFMPVAFVCAELASGWPKAGGIYAWIREAFGQKSGAIVMWLEWIGGGVAYLPLVLSFIAATLAYVIHPELAHNRFFLLFVMLTALWVGTFINFLGLKTSEWISSFGMVLGSLIPGVAIILLGFGWFFMDNTHYPNQIIFHSTHLFPSFNFETLVYFTGIILSFGGIEVAGFYIHDTKDPKRTFPKAVLIAALIIITIYTLGALAIALIVPKNEITLHAGLMQAVSLFFETLGMPWATRLFAGLTVIGALALLNTWITGPSQGLLVSAQHNDLPAIAKKTNKEGAPVAILSLQACLSSFLAVLFLFMPSISSIYFIFTMLATQLILIMYFMLFLCVIRLRQTQPDTPRLYQVPGGKWGVWIIAGIGAITCFVAFFLGFVPPKEFDFGSTERYVSILITGLVLFSAPPFIYHFIKSRGTPK
jgi:amino acid transporter